MARTINIRKPFMRFFSMNYYKNKTFSSYVIDDVNRILIYFHSLKLVVFVGTVSFCEPASRIAYCMTELAVCIWTS